MARTIVYPRAAKRSATEGGPTRQADTLPDKLLKYIPGEVIAFYVPNGGEGGASPSTHSCSFRYSSSARQSGSRGTVSREET